MAPAYPSMVEENDDQKDPKALPHPLEAAFGRIFEFLFVAAMSPEALKAAAVKMSTKDAVVAWADSQHTEQLEQKHHKALPQAAPEVKGGNFAAMTEKFGNLADTIAARELYELQRKRESQEVEFGVKKFEKLSPIIRNTLLMFSVVPGLTQDNIEELEPTGGALSLLEISSGTVVRQILHNYMRQKGCMVHLQLGMCNSLKTLIISSFTEVFTLSNLSVFHCDPEKVGDGIDENESAILTEKANLGELKREDISKLTKNEKYLPMDFWGYEHMVKNFQVLAAFLGGEDCLTSREWKKVLQHAREHQALYKKYERENDIFYISLCNNLNQRTQTAIHSGAGGCIDEIKKNHIDFSNIFDDIEFNRYHIRRPSWIPKKRKQEQKQHAGGDGGGAGNGFTGITSPTKKKIGRGEIVINDNQHEDCKVPTPGNYHEVFSPKFLDKRYPKHEDGTEKCNNWHHGGRCRSKCSRIESHKKTLTKKEIAEGKEFVVRAFERWSAANKNGAVPPGQPPTNNDNEEEKAEGED